MLRSRVSRTDSSRTAPRSVLATTVFVVVISFGICLGTAFSQYGQEQSGQGMGRGERHQMPSVADQLKKMTKALNLSDDQQGKLKPILEDQHKQMEQLRNDSSMSREDRFSKMRGIHENVNTQIKELLNEDQQKKFDKMQQEQHSHMGRHGGNGSDHPNENQ